MNELPKKQNNEADNSRPVDTTETIRLSAESGFRPEDIDFSIVADHINIHTSGIIAGSQFNGETFSDTNEIIELIKGSLPETMQYDDRQRVELTIEIPETVVGFSGVKSIEELKNIQGVTLVKGTRDPSGTPAEVDGVQGAWYPEAAKNSETGRFEVVLNPDGTVKNPQARFVPDCWIANVPAAHAEHAFATNQITVIIQKDKDGKPVVLTAYPGELAPPVPVIIDTDSYKVDTLHSQVENEYWDTHAFIQTV